MGDEHGRAVLLTCEACEEPSGAAGSPSLRPAAPCRRRETTTAPGRSYSKQCDSRVERRRRLLGLAGDGKEGHARARGVLLFAAQERQEEIEGLELRPREHAAPQHPPVDVPAEDPDAVDEPAVLDREPRRAELFDELRLLVAAEVAQ